MLKECWTLGKMLFASKPSEELGKEMDILVMNHFPAKNKTVMSWCGMIVVRKNKVDLLMKFLETKNGKRLLAHEAGHVVQAVHHSDSWVKYYLSYAWNWLKHGFLSPLSANYYVNKYEAEAFGNEERPEYWDNYRKSDIMKYNIEYAKDIYKMLGGTPDTWKEYVKAL